MNPIRLTLIALLPLALAATPVPPATATAPSLPIKELQGLTPNDAALKAATSTKPIVIKTEKEASDYFSAAELAKVVKLVDFKTQILLVFAWQGSGQDKVDYTIAESFPEQIRFTYTPGMTRDLRPHLNLYALRANVTWSAK